jgi:AAA family ATP:ADP antiporter
MLRRLERFLDLRTGELERGLLLFAYLFLVIASFVVGKSVRDALFIDEFGALLLPYADIGVAVLVGVWVSVYLRLARRTNLRQLLVTSLLFFAVNSLVFWWIAHSIRPAWLTPVIYVWVGMFGVVAPAQVWTLATSVLTTREAKRMYGFIGSGATSGWIVAGYLTQVTAARFGAEATLLGMAVALLAAAAIVVRLWQCRPMADREPETALDASNMSAGIRASIRLIAGSRYLTAIAAVILLSSFTTAVAGWQFKAFTGQAIEGRDALAAFFGRFNFYAGLLAFTLQWLLTGRLLRRLGLGFALFVVPVGLLFGSISLLVFGSLAAVVALRGIDQVLRYSIDKPTVELLYLPVPSDQTVAVKSFIDTVVWRLGDGLAGATILIAAGFGRMAIVQITWVNLLLLGGWLAAAWVAQRLYVENLRDSIHHYRLDAERASATGLERKAADLLTSKLGGGDPSEVLYALRLLGASSHHAMHPAVRGLLTHASPGVRAEAVRVLDEGGDAGVIPTVEKLLHDPDLNVRTQALLYVAHHAQIDPLDRIEKLGEFDDFSIRAAMVTFLAQPGTHENIEAARVLLDRMLQDEEPRARLEAARLLELLPDQFEDQLRAVFTSGDTEPVRHALRAVGHLRKRKMISRVVDRLGDPELADDATEALAAFGDRVVGTLRDYLADPDTPVAVRRQIPLVLLRIGSQAAHTVLADSMLDADTQARYNVIIGLNKLGDLHPTWSLDGRLVETVLGAEIMGHLRSYQIMGTLGRAMADPVPVTDAIQDAMERELERIFRLLKLLFPRQDLHSAYVGVQSRNPVVHDNALEFLENILSPQLRSLLLPLLDSEVPTSVRTELANRVLGAQVADSTEAVQSLLASEDPWLRSCAAYAIGALNLGGFDAELERLSGDPDPLLRETARQAQSRLSGARADS